MLHRLIKPFNTVHVALIMYFSLLLFFFFSGSLFSPILPNQIPTKSHILTKNNNTKEPFKDIFKVYKTWDSQVGCAQFVQKHKGFVKNRNFSVLQRKEVTCGVTGLSRHVSVLVKGWTWIPDNMDSVYSCGCGLTCLWTKSTVLADKPDALLFETVTPPIQYPWIPDIMDNMYYCGCGLTKNNNPKEPFINHFNAFQNWDSQVGCAHFEEKHKEFSKNRTFSPSERGGKGCGETGLSRHVSVLVRGWTWIPDNMDDVYYCGLTCLWTKPTVLADRPDALLFETVMPPIQRSKGQPLRVYMDLEAGRKRSGSEDIFISYHAKDDVQSTYAGALFHNNRNYHLSSEKNNDILIYWSSSRCLPQRNQLAKSLLEFLPHHSFGKCLNNVGGLDMALNFYPECAKDSNTPKWWDHLHCAMSHYKFVLAIENTVTESYVTEKLFYALDSGAVPVYFGAPNVWDFVPPNSIIDGTKFSSMEELASYIKALANDPVAYAEYHAWRRCGVMGNYGNVRAMSLDTLPCRLCEEVSRRGGRDARAL